MGTCQDFYSAISLAIPIATSSDNKNNQKAYDLLYEEREKNVSLIAKELYTSSQMKIKVKIYDFDCATSEKIPAKRFVRREDLEKSIYSSLGNAEASKLKGRKTGKSDDSCCNIF